MIRIMSIGIALTMTLPTASALAQTISYTVGSSSSKKFQNSTYYETSVTCNNKSKKKNKIVTEANGGFGSRAYYANEAPYEVVDKKNNYIMLKANAFRSFDAAAQKACS